MVETDVKVQLVTFYIGKERYGVDIMDVKEIVGRRDIRPIPYVPPYVAGILNLRGSIFPIIDLHKRFHLKEVEMNEDDILLSGFIIIEVNKRHIGVIIDKVSRVISVNPNLVQLPPQVISGIGAEYIQGVVNDDGEYLIILNIKKLFDPKELKSLENIVK
jgi:purine-binding chemotaxis protein CheW